MPPNTSLYRFRINVSDIDRNFYGDLDFRVAMHPSEAFPYLLTRVLAYALCFEAGLDFSNGGLSDTDAPAISLPDPQGGQSLCIEVGNPSVRRLHRTSKSSRRVKVFTYKNPEALLRELGSGNLHNAEQIEIYSIGSSFIEQLEAMLDRDNRWGLLRNDGAITVSNGNDSVSSELKRHSLH